MTSPNTIQDSIEHSRQVGRIVYDLLSKRELSGADSVNLTNDSSNLKLQYFKNRVEIENSVLDAVWADSIHRWLLERDIGSILKPALGLSLPSVENGVECFWSLCSYVNNLALMRVRLDSTLAGKRRLSISQVQHYSKAELCQEAGIAPELIDSLLLTTTAGQTGLLVAASVRQEQRQAVQALMLALSAGHLLQLSEDHTEDPEQLAIVIKREQLVLSMCAEDITEALVGLRARKIDYQILSGIVLQVAVRKVCQHCAREAVIDQTLTKILPDCIRPDLRTTAMVGRGCKACGQSGSHGIACVTSLADATVCRSLNATDRDLASLAKRLYAAGVRPILQQGVFLVRQGFITLEALFEQVKILPDAYHSCMKAELAAKPEVGLETDFFSNATSTIQPSSPFVNKPTTPGQQQPLPAADFTQAPRERPIVLIVEDDADQRNILDMVLKSANYDVRQAQDGMQALAAIEKEKPDLVLTDLMMPKLDGATLISHLKRDQNTKRIPVLVLTVLHDAEKECHVLDIGADDYCEKTIQRKVLLKRVENLLRRGA